MLLYRLCCLFPVKIDTDTGVDRYKSVWEVEIWHIPSGLPLCIGEHKGASHMWPEYPLKDLGYDSDVVELTELLLP